MCINNCFYKSSFYEHKNKIVLWLFIYIMFVGVGWMSVAFQGFISEYIFISIHSWFKKKKKKK